MLASLGGGGGGTTNMGSPGNTSSNNNASSNNLQARDTTHPTDENDIDEDNNRSSNFKTFSSYPTASGGAMMSNQPVCTKQKRIELFFKGIAGWALCYGMGYTFDLVSSPQGVKHSSEVNSSAAFALLMHSMGFSVFLMSFTGQIRWLALNGIVGLVLMWVFNNTGMDAKWVVFSTHSVGYVLLAVVVVVMILVFGGVVLVWSHLIDFLKEVLIRYPEVKDDLSEKKVLEQVLIR
jgi:hypothetical protein